MTTRDVSWIALDWGTSQVRAWALSESGDVLAKTESDQGMSKITSEDYEPHLLSLVGDWLPKDSPTSVLACGMLGARAGWFEAPYGAVPGPPLASAAFVTAPTSDPRLSVKVVPGLQQNDPADVMRGEETQIAGFLARYPDFDGQLCLPGTHSKWARVKAGEVLSFQSFMTGELFALLAEQSVLRLTLGDGWNQEAFLAAVQEVLAAPQSFPGMLFPLRAAALLESLDPNEARARLSGLLVGAELAARTAPDEDRDLPLGLIGSGVLVERYESALRKLTREIIPFHGEEATLAGLKMARASLDD